MTECEEEADQVTVQPQSTERRMYWMAEMEGMASERETWTYFLTPNDEWCFRSYPQDEERETAQW